jgi:eukaryotic-like serine/threonine-protein kinase
MSAPRSLSTVSGYETLAELGRGGMGIAYLARGTGVGGFERLVVIKRLHKHLLEESEALKRFLHEARLAAYVNHANVVDVQHADTDADGPYMVLDYVEGASLDELTDRAVLKRAPLPLPVVLRITLDVLAGLSAIHEARRPDGTPLCVLHRDLTPHNILVGRDGVSRVADFGVAKSTLKTAETDRGYMVGKLLYLAPEYLRQEAVGPPLDVYALGVTLWVTLAGTDPWPTADDAQLMTKIFTEGLPPIERSVHLPPQVAAIINRACAVEVMDRYPTAAAMMEALEELGRQTSWVASHSEVARTVEALAGADLERRRRTVAEAGAALPPEPASAARSGGALSSGPVENPRAARDERTMSAVAVAPKAAGGASRLRVAVGLAGGAAALIAIGVLVGRGGSTEPSSGAASEPGAAREPRPSPPAEPSSVPQLTPEDLPHAPDPLAAPVDESPARTMTSPRRPGSAPRPPPAAKTAPETSPAKPDPAPALVEPPPPKLEAQSPPPAPPPAGDPPMPSEITKKNPYR